MSDISDLPPEPPNREPQPPRRHDPPDHELFYGDPIYAVKQLNGPAIALMVVALISGLWCCYSIFSALFTSPEDNINAIRDLSQIMDIPIDEELLMQFAGSGSKIIPILIWSFFLLIDLFLFFAAIQMRSLRNYSLAITAAIIAIIPCCHSACCLLNMPFGIWALVVLRKPEIKAAFER